MTAWCELFQACLVLQAFVIRVNCRCAFAHILSATVDYKKLTDEGWESYVSKRCASSGLGPSVRRRWSSGAKSGIYPISQLSKERRKRRMEAYEAAWKIWEAEHMGQEDGRREWRCMSAEDRPRISLPGVPATPWWVIKAMPKGAMPKGIVPPAKGVILMGTC